ncbi:hypothetical protein EV385_4274 [Krasilnikovia cinnamomea]|uniref:DUF4190 domain-containing protein n=1 Tax=Krasilnikovia cinnamomea TaxID=349313 RepID=A0A4Q7ZNY6_9ACTN|nr:hypothetical protein [Krasilnikovia cinnamomea]RZU52411.1 hypothetical protein EV385_4274 [Krasilnikovia cinnamomea]
MELLTGTMALLVIVTGTAMLSGHPVIMIVLAAVLGGLVLLLTRGREIRARRRVRRTVPRSATAGRPAANRTVVVSDVVVQDVVPEDGLNPVPLDGRTAAALMCGTVGLFLFNPLFGPLAVGLGVAALRRGTPGRWGRPAAVAAVLLGLADLLVWAVLLLSRLALHGVLWHT